MAQFPGRTYKYYVGGTPLFEFGHGLSLTTFETSCVADAEVKIVCNVTNTGTERDGDDVLFVYHSIDDEDVRARASHPIPLKQLVDFERVTVEKNGMRAVKFALNEDAFKVVNEEGVRTHYEGKHTITVVANGYEKKFTSYR